MTKRVFPDTKAAAMTAELSAVDKQTLMDVAGLSIQHGLLQGAALPVEAQRFNSALRQLRATFVTLNLQGRLRGCIGTLKAHQPLVMDIADNAFAAAFHDPRFQPINQAEASRLEIHLSILTPAQPMTFASQEHLLEQLRPGVDGLILEEPARPGCRGTFLPAVWESLPDKAHFWAHLKQKAGLPADYWSSSLRVWRYEAQNVP